MSAAPIPKNEPERLAALVSYEILDTEAEEVFDALTKLAASACNVPIALISLIDSHRQWFKSVQGLPGVTETPRDLAFCAHAILQPGLMEVPDARKDPRFSDNPLVTGEPGIRFYAGMPLTNPQGHALGTLCVIDRKPRSLAPSQRDALSQLARLVVSLMEAGKTRLEAGRARTAAEDGEVRFYSVAELFSDWYWEQDEAFRFVKCVDIGKQSDFDINESLGKTPWEIPSYEMTAADRDELEKTLARQRPFRDILLKRRNLSGALCHVSISGTPVVDATGRFRGYRGIGRDVSAQVHAEMALRESEERFRNLTELSSDWYWEQDENFRFTKISGDLLEKAGLDPAELIGKTRWEVPIANMTEADWSSHRALLEARRPFYDMEIHRVDRSGRMRHLSLSGEPVFDAGGRFRGYRGVGKEISARKVAEEKIRDHARQQRLLAEFGQEALANTNLEAVLNRALALLSETLRVSHCSILERDPHSQELRYKAVIGWPKEWIGQGERPSPPASRSEGNASSPLAQFGVRSGMQLPILGSSSAFGILRVHTLESRRFTEDDANFLQSVANILAIAIERKQFEARLTYLAEFDELTRLPNRHLFNDRLAQAIAQAKRGGYPVGVLYIDLDRFKVVNDTLGHEAGDRALREAAARFLQCVRSGDTVGRLGGDEFCALVSDLGKLSDAGLIAQKIVDAMARPFDLDGNETYITASVGVALYPSDSIDSEALIMSADAAMYLAKEQGRNNYQYFTREMNERAKQRVRMETLLRRALQRREFLMHYQPKVDLGSGAICGFEALLRWEHPENGLMLPAEFVPLLEDTGLIVPVGEWVMHEVLEQIETWQKAGITVPPIAINLSARQFQHKDLEIIVHRTLQSTTIDPSLVQFELTESMLMKDPEGAARVLRGLKDSGVKLAVDDFGTGYSSLSYLKRFPLDALKIDITFIRDVTTDPEDAAITMAIIGLAHTLKLKVVAEGVETREQLDFLSAHACDEIQGEYFCGAVAPLDCGRILREGRRLKT